MYCTFSHNTWYTDLWHPPAPLECHILPPLPPQPASDSPLAEHSLPSADCPIVNGFHAYICHTEYRGNKPSLVGGSHTILYLLSLFICTLMQICMLYSIKILYFLLLIFVRVPVFKNLGNYMHLYLPYYLSTKNLILYTYIWKIFKTLLLHMQFHVML